MFLGFGGSRFFFLLGGLPRSKIQRAACSMRFFNEQRLCYFLPLFFLLARAAFIAAACVSWRSAVLWLASLPAASFLASRVSRPGWMPLRATEARLHRPPQRLSAPQPPLALAFSSLRLAVSGPRQLCRECQRACRCGGELFHLPTPLAGGERKVMSSQRPFLALFADPAQQLLACC